MSLGDEINTRGIKVDIDEQRGEFISDVVVIAEVVGVDGKTRLSIESGEMTNWIKENGMLDIAHKITSHINKKEKSWE